MRLNPPDRTAYPAGYGLAPWGAEPWCIRGLFRSNVAMAIVTLAVLFSAPALTEKRVALVIGNGDYRNATAAAQSEERRRGCRRRPQAHRL